MLGGLPSNFVGSLTGLTQGHFPVHAKATYADDISEEQIASRKRKAQRRPGSCSPASDRRGINIYAAPTRR